MSEAIYQETFLIGAIKMRSGDEIRLELTKFSGAYRVNIRRWFLAYPVDAYTH